jgi:ABC-type bacteriocin/lantibiotic exporter with double-glycine peptidase domain
MLQIIFGLILLAFYHPTFIIFGFVLIGFLSLTFYLSGPKGLDSSLVESKYKYKIAHWLEEIARTLTSFKLAGFTNLPLQKLDYYLNGYLNSRQKHFKIMILQFGNIIVFKTAITGGLLIMGSLLVVNREISLGQFVASEIVIILIINAVEKLVVNLDVIYDMLTAVEKLGHITDIPLEKNTGVIIDRGDDDKGITLNVKDLKYKYHDAKEYVLNGVNFTINPGENVCIAGYNGSGKNTLLHIISGILDEYEGGISINNLSLRDINLNSLRDLVGRYNSKEDIFESNIFDNISMGIARTTINDVNWAIEKVGLNDWVNQLPNGLNTQLIAAGKGLNSSIIKKIILARAIAEKPNLLITTDFLGGFEKLEKLKIINLLLDKSHGWSLLSVTNDPTLLANCDKIILMDKGKVVAEGSFEELKSNKMFGELVLN